MQIIYIKNKLNNRQYYEFQDTAVVNGSITCMPDTMLKGANGYKFTSLDFANYWAAINNEYPVLKSFATGNLADVSTAKPMIDTSWYKADAKTLVIDSAEDLYGFWQLASSETFEGKTIQLGADIDLNNGWIPSIDAQGNLANIPDNPFLPINSSTNRFAGTFDGKGHTISGVYMDVEQDYVGLFGATALGSVLKNFKLTNSYFDTSEAYENLGIGTVVGELRGTMDSVYSDAIVNTIGRQLGGLAGRVIYSDKNFKEKVGINNSWYDGQIFMKTDSRWGAGIAGYVSYAGAVKKTDIDKYSIDFTNCLNSGYLNTNRTTSASSKDPDTSFGGQYIGGLIGGTDGALTLNVTDCMMSGNIDAVYHTYIGAIISRVNHNAIYNFTNTYATHESYEKDRLYNDITETGKLNKKNFILVNKADTVNYYAYYSTELDYENEWMAMKTDTPVLRSFADASLEANGNADWYKKGHSPYIIDTPEEFDGFRILVNGGKTFKGETVKLAANITMDKNMKFTPIGVSNTVCFDGTLEGQGYTISGINIDLADTRNVGLFGYLGTNSHIKNFKLADSSIVNSGSGAGNTGILAGVGKGNISNVYVKADVSLTTDSNPSGGFIGIFDNNGKERTISGCWFAGTINSSTTRSGGFVGRVYKGTLNIENCLNTGAISASGKVGGFVGSPYGAETEPTVNIKNSVGLGTVTGSTYAGSVVGSGHMSSANIENVYVVSTLNGYGLAGPESASSYANYKGIPMTLAIDALTGNNAYVNTVLDLKETWQVTVAGTPELKMFATGTAMTNFTGVKVAKSWYYNGFENSGSSMVLKTAQIASNADMRGFMQFVNTDNMKFTGQTIELAKSLTFDKENEPWTKIGKSGSVYFDGTFDGKGYTLKGIYLNDTSSHTGLFGYTGTNSVIKNFAVKDSSITGAYNTGVVAGVSKGNISDIYVASDVSVNCKNDVNAGGIIGIFDNNGQTRSIENCWFDGTITNTSDRVAGIAGRCYKGTLNVKNCLVTGTIVSKSTGSNARAGGLVGNADSGSTLNLENCIMMGTVKAATTTTVGSVIGRTNGKPIVNITKVFTTDKRTDLNGNEVSFNTTNATAGIGSSSTNDATINGSVSIVTAAKLKGLEGVTTTGFDFCSTNYLDGIWVATAEGPEMFKFSTKDAILDIPGQENLATRWYHEGVQTDDGMVYTIKTAADMYGFARYVNMAKDDFTGAIVKLDADIKFNGNWVPSVNASGDVTNLPSDVNVWAPIGDYDFTNGFNGIFDGQGHTISGLYVNHSKRDAGLFGITQTKAQIKNFTITNSYIKVNGNYNAVVSGTFLGTLMENIKVADSVTLKADYANGGFAGMISTNIERKISNCWFAGNIFGADKTHGGILGRSYAGTNTIENCLVTGKITSTINADARVGAFVGSADGTQKIIVKNCLSVATLNVASRNHVGNAIGKCIIENQIENAYVANMINYTGTDTSEFVTTNTIAGTAINKALFASKDAKEVVPGLFTNNTSWKAVEGKHPVLAWTTK